jgi:hypothetical protein
MNIHVKESPRKIKHPADDPLRAKKEAIGKANLPKMLGKMENDAERRDYMKRVESNPLNVPGRPAFYPALELRSSLSEMRAARLCKTENCGGCCTYNDHFICPRCHADNSDRQN